MESSTIVSPLPIRENYSVALGCGDLNHTSVRHGHSPEEPQRTAVLCRKELHFNVVPCVEGILAGLTNTSLGEGGGGAGVSSPIPWSCHPRS